MRQTSFCNLEFVYVNNHVMMLMVLSLNYVNLRSYKACHLIIREAYKIVARTLV